MSHRFRINRQFVLKIAAPTVAISILLFGLGVFAARSVHTTYLSSSNLIANEVHGMIAAQDLYTEMREIRYRLLLFDQTKLEEHIRAIPMNMRSAESHLEAAARLAHTPSEIEVLQIVRNSWIAFEQAFGRFEKEKSNPKPSDSLADLLSDINAVIAPSHDFLELNRDVVDKTNDANKRIADHTQQGFLLLGICGGAGGLIAGLVIARSIGESILQLDVSVRGAAGKLSHAIGPITITRSGDFRELEAELLQMETHITTVVERLQRHEMEALHREQLAALGQLAAGLAHELRNPLTPIKILVQDALERDDETRMPREHLNLIDQEIRRLERLLQDFLDFARPPTPNIVAVDLRQLLDGAEGLIQGRALAQNVKIHCHHPDFPVMTQLDVSQMNQVMLNLLLNSLDMLPLGGDISIGVRGSISFENKTWHEITVRDSGPGFSPEILQRLFEPFVSSKETGTGLGMSICQRIVESHCGRISAQNLADRGAEITILLPPSDSRPTSKE